MSSTKKIFTQKPGMPDEIYRLAVAAMCWGRWQSLCMIQEMVEEAGFRWRKVADEGARQDDDTYLTLGITMGDIGAMYDQMKEGD